MLSILLLSPAVADCGVKDYDKIDCGYVGIDQGKCESQGCCWQPVSGQGNIPWCYHPAGTPTQCFAVANTTTSPFSSSEVSAMRSFFLANVNIGGKGGVVASPDRNTPGGSYYYHWERDAALSMRVLYETSDFATADNYFKSYVQWVSHVHETSDPNNIDIRVEVKFNLPDGDVYTGGWCRPQTDAPGLRAITLIQYANELIKRGQKDYVAQYLWTKSSARMGGAIKYDLDWVAANWTQNGCDLWEEVRSDDFFWNRFTFRKALVLGAQFAASQGDSSSAARYKAAANDLTNALKVHWNGGFVYESSNRQKDSAVIVGFNDGYADDGLWGPTDPQVAATIKTLINTFCVEYDINRKDYANGVPGVLLGRYPGDTYAGGNPWPLLTAALAQLFYRGAQAVVERGSLLSAEDTKVWLDALSLPSSTRFEHPLEFARALSSAGDGVMLRIRYHVAGDSFHIAEQFERTSGLQKSAKDLTWSYAEVLRASAARSKFLELARTKYPQRVQLDEYFN